ncbi:MAG TPA: GGDEF domain-containing protein [Thermohalobaculum sp.]|nr:GGDEF domain-containing protein [Thermohalobaculum sp.]
MPPGTISSKAVLLRGVGAMLGAAALASIAVRLSAEAGAGGAVPSLAPWASAGLSGALVATLGCVLAWPVLRRAERLAADNRRTAEELAHQRSCDPATGLPNRRKFDLLIERSLAVARRHDFTVGLLLIHLKGWQRSSLRLDPEDANDFLGEIAALIGRKLRAADSIARIGSEDLAVVIGKVESRESLETLAERIVAGIDKLAVRRPEAGVSCTLGGALASPSDASGHQALIRRADEALAEAEGGTGTRWKLRAAPDRPDASRLSVVR